MVVPLDYFQQRISQLRTKARQEGSHHYIVMGRFAPTPRGSSGDDFQQVSFYLRRMPRYRKNDTREAVPLNTSPRLRLSNSHMCTHLVLDARMTSAKN